MPKYCEETGCKKRANYNVRGQKAKFCVTHSCKETMVNVTKRTCQECDTQPTFNYPNKKQGEYCVAHKKDGMVSTRAIKCGVAKCKSNAYYNLAGLEPKYCNLHKQDGMINIKSHTCEICGKGAGFSTPDKKGGWFCGEHKKDGMILPYVNYCTHPECQNSEHNTEALFNYEGEKCGIFCSKHKKPNMINISYKSCLHDGCNKYPKYNYPWEKKGIYCSTHAHKDKGMINLKKMECADEFCNSAPSYNYKGMPARYCSKHKEPDMIIVNKKVCNKCSNYAYYNEEGKLTPEYCFAHKSDNMILSYRKYCVFQKCYKIPSYNYRGNKTPIYCLEHIPDPRMINVRSKKTCLKCEKDPNFNYFSEKTGLFCMEHAEVGMINIKGRRCQYDGCQDGENEYPKLANYNYPDKNYAVYCREHKENGMTTLSKKCSICHKHQATYNKPGLKPEYCGIHKDQGMIFDPRKRCEIDQCQDFALYSYNGIKGRFCEVHAPSTYISALNEKCNGCGLIDIVDINGYCMICDATNFQSLRLIKQKEVVSWLINSEHNDFRSIDSVPEELLECGDQYRPDILYDIGTHYIIIEVDENQHNSDSYKMCDLPRMINIQQTLALPTIFIRYNPDKFRCGKVKIDAGKPKRKNTLLRWIKDAKEKKEIDNLEVLYLFYNDYIESKTIYQKINILEEVKNFQSK